MKEEKSTPKLKPEVKPETTNHESKGKLDAYTSPNRDIKCLKCQGRDHIASNCISKKVMTVRDDEEIESDDESDGDSTPSLEGIKDDEEIESDDESDGDSTPSLEDIKDEEYALSSELNMLRGDLNVQVKVYEELQQDNLFHNRYLVQGKVSSVIIDGKSCTNVASSTIVEKLGLLTYKHPEPCLLQWLNDSGEVKETKQVMVQFCIGKFEDDVLCDVVPMQAGHLLLGQPWQFDKRVKHDEYNNKYSFEFNQKPITLVPMSPQQVYEDQLRVQKESVKKKESEKKKRSRNQREAKKNGREKTDLEVYLEGKKREKIKRKKKSLYATREHERNSLSYPFDPGGDLRTNPFQEEGNDEDMDRTKIGIKDSLQRSTGQLKRATAKRFKEAFNGLILKYLMVEITSLKLIMKAILSM